MTDKICERCGKNFKAYAYGYETMCYKCQCEKNLEDVKESILSGETTSTDCEDDVICPWCGEAIDGDCETREFYEEGTHVFQCPECDIGDCILTRPPMSWGYVQKRGADDA